jgi:hypothetical protein
MVSQPRDTQPEPQDDAALTGPTGQRGERGTSAPAGVEFTDEQQAYINRLMVDERRMSERRVKDSDEIKQLRARARVADQLEGQRHEDRERLEAERDSAKAERAQALAKAENALSRAHFTAVATQRGIPSDRLEDAATLANLSGVHVNLDTSEVTGVEEAVQQLVESRPWLVGPGVGPRSTQAPRPAPQLNGGAQGQPAGREARIEQAMQEMRAQGFGRI